MTRWLLVGVGLVLLLQVGVVLAWALHNAVADLRLRRRRQGSHLLRALYDELDAIDSPRVRQELSQRRLDRDLETLEHWLDLVSVRGEDPAELTPEDFEVSGLVDRCIEDLRHHRRWTRRATAAATLGWTGSHRAVQPLLVCAQDVRGEAVRVRSVALRALSRIHHPAAAPPLLEALDSAETWLPPAIASILIRIGEPVLQPLCRTLQDPDASAQGRRWAAQILGDIGHRRALPALHRALSDLDPEIRARAGRSLGQLADERSVSPLLDRLLTDPIPFVRTAVARGLGAISTDRTVQFLVESLGDPEWWVRLRSVEALEQIGEPAQDLLRTTLHDRDATVAREAARALEGQGVVADAVERIRAEGYVPEAAEFLIDVGLAGNIEPLLDELESEDLATLQTVVRILSRVGDRRAGDALVALLDRDLPTDLHARVLEALRRVGADEHVDRILPALEHRDDWVRRAAVEYVATFGGSGVVLPVLPLVGDSDGGIRESALRLLERLPLDPSLDDPVARCLEDPIPTVRAQAVRVLCAAQDFPALLDSEVPERVADPRIRAALLDGLRLSASPDALPLIANLAAVVSVDDLDRLTLVVQRAFESAPAERIDREIGARRGPGSAPSARWIAATLLGIRGGPHREPLLREFLDDPDPRVRAASVIAAGSSHLREATLREFVTDSLEDVAPHVVRAGLRAVAHDPRRSLHAEVEKCLRHTDDDVRVDAALALAFCSSPGRRRVRGVGLDRSVSARLASTLARLYRGDVDAIDDWIDLLQDEEQRARLHVWVAGDHLIARAILENRGEDSESLPRRLLACRAAFDVERILIEELDSHPDAEVRRRALEGLSRLGTERVAGRVLSAFLKDHAPAVRGAALRHLVRYDVLGRRRHFVEVALRDPVESLQVAGVHLCVSLPDEDAVDLLTGHLDTRRPMVLQAVSDILAGMFTEEPERVSEVYRRCEKKLEAVLGLLETLEKTPAPIQPDLRAKLLHSRWARVRSRALAALLSRMGDEAWPALRRAITDPAPTVRRQALKCLSTPRLASVLGSDPAAARALLDEARHDPSSTVRARAALSLGALRPSGARTWLRELRQDRDPRVTRAADRAWKRLARDGEKEVQPA